MKQFDYRSTLRKTFVEKELAEVDHLKVGQSKGKNICSKPAIEVQGKAGDRLERPIDQSSGQKLDAKGPKEWVYDPLDSGTSWVFYRE